MEITGRSFRVISKRLREMLAGELEVIGRTASIGHVQHCQIHTVQPEILAVIKFGGLPPNRVFADLKLAVWNSIAIHTCTRYKFWRILMRFRLKPSIRQI